MPDHCIYWPFWRPVWSVRPRLFSSLAPQSKALNKNNWLRISVTLFHSSRWSLWYKISIIGDVWVAIIACGILGWHNLFAWTSLPVCTDYCSILCVPFAAIQPSYDQFPDCPHATSNVTSYGNRSSSYSKILRSMPYALNKACFSRNPNLCVYRSTVLVCKDFTGEKTAETFGFLSGVLNATIKLACKLLGGGQNKVHLAGIWPKQGEG